VTEQSYVSRFVPVDPDEIPNIREARRGRVSYPLLKGFLESMLPIARLDRTGISRTSYSLSMTLGLYIKNHELPIKVCTRKGEIYLARTDVDDEGNIIGDSSGNLPDVPDDDPSDVTELDSAEVERRFAEEAVQVTK